MMGWDKETLVNEYMSGFNNSQSKSHRALKKRLDKGGAVCQTVLVLTLVRTGRLLQAAHGLRR